MNPKFVRKMPDLFLCALCGLSVLQVTLAIYSDQWAVHISGGMEMANEIAAKHGFINFGQIFPDFYHFQHRKVEKRSAEPSLDHHRRLTLEPQVQWAQQQLVKRRVKRDYKTSFRDSRRRPPLNDPRWPQMWYLNRGKGLDMDVQNAWAIGATGKGVVVTILDDGLEKDHPDILKNYDPMASYDVNNHDEDPMPRYDLIDSNRHGTRCAGEVAADANNSICAVGVAFEASVGGVRMLDGDVTDAVEARSLSLNPQHIDIYSASWGPDDDGKTVDGPGELATRAFVEGITKGRAGKGSIFVWASGNGGRDHDNCNCDGYTNSIWTLSISSATENGLVPWYSEACSSTMATTYSSGSSGERQIITTDLHHTCTSSHTGTSASAPLAAGICALALQANRNLTWRDMQHIVVRTARPANLHARDWQTNGVGRNVSHSFGYGLMDAAAMTQVAKKWKRASEQHKCEVPAPHIDKMIPAKSQVTLQLDVKSCPGVNYLEHVQARISMSATRRGDIQIYLTSASGTRSTLLAKRPHDTSRAGFQAWPFMSVHMWGEQPFGVWTLEIHNEGRYLGRATLQDWSLIFHGTEDSPDTFSTTTTTSTTSSTTTTLPPPTTTTTTTTEPTITTTTIIPKPTTLFTTVDSGHFFETMNQYPVPNTLYPYLNQQDETVPQPLPKPKQKSKPNSKLQAPQYSSPFSPSNLKPNLGLDLLHDEHLPPENTESASLSEWNVILYGTKNAPGEEEAKEQEHVEPEHKNTIANASKNTSLLPSSAGCVKISPAGECLGCSAGLFILHGECVTHCPPHHYSITPSSSETSYASCLPCYYACYTCSGPNDYECLSCFGDAALHEITLTEKFCHPKSLLQEIISSKRWYTGLIIGFFINSVIIIGLLVFIVQERWYNDGEGRVCCVKRNARYRAVNGALKDRSGQVRGFRSTVPFHDNLNDSEEEDI